MPCVFAVTLDLAVEKPGVYTKRHLLTNGYTVGIILSSSTLDFREGKSNKTYMHTNDEAPVCYVYVLKYKFSVCKTRQ